MSCLFQSLGSFVKTTPEELRRQICAYLLTDAVLIEPDSKVSELIKFQPDIPCESLEQYVQAMSRPNTNGGAIEISAFCELYSRNVKVIQVGARQCATYVEFISKPSNPWVTVSWNGNHYEPV